MRTKRAEMTFDYSHFTNPYKGLATMILVQADCDLKMLDGEETAYKSGYVISKWEIINFLRSPWASFLATSIGIDPAEMELYTARAIG